MAVTHEHVADWLAGYERAWRTPGTDALAALFTPDATYQLAPYDEPLTGLEAIAEMWDAERDGPDEEFTMESEVVAVDADAAVARVEVHYAGPPARDYRDLWIMEFADDGRCRAFEEWPFHPGAPRTAAGSG